MGSPVALGGLTRPLLLSTLAHVHALLRALSTRRRLQRLLLLCLVAALAALTWRRRRRRLAYRPRSLHGSDADDADDGGCDSLPAELPAAWASWGLPTTVERSRSDGRLLPSHPSASGGRPLKLQVSLSRFKLRNLAALRKASDGRTPAADKPPPVRLRLRFADRPALLSDVGARANPGLHIAWSECFSFEHEATLPALSLQELEVLVLTPGAVLGRLVLPLEVLACGPAPNDHAMVDASGNPSGARLVFRCRISERRKWRLQLRRVLLRLTTEATAALGLDGSLGSSALGGPLLFSLSYTFTSGSTGASSHESAFTSPASRFVLPERDRPCELVWEHDESEAASELPLVVHEGAFWEVAHGALRLQLCWRRSSALNSSVGAWRRRAVRNASLGNGDSPAAMARNTPAADTDVVEDRRELSNSAAGASDRARARLQRRGASGRVVTSTVVVAAPDADDADGDEKQQAGDADIGTDADTEPYGSAEVGTEADDGADAGTDVGADTNADPGGDGEEAADEPADLTPERERRVDPLDAAVGNGDDISSVTAVSPQAAATGGMRRLPALPCSPDALTEPSINEQGDASAAAATCGCGAASCAPAFCSRSSGDLTAPWPRPLCNSSSGDLGRLVAGSSSPAMSTMSEEAQIEEEAARTWLVMEKLLVDMPESDHLRSRRRRHVFERGQSDGILPVTLHSACEVDRACSPGSSRKPNGHAYECGDSPSRAVVVNFEEDMYHRGRVIGKLSGSLALLDSPVIEQQPYGTITEHGITTTAPVVMGAGARGSRGTGGGDAGRRLAQLSDELALALASGDKTSRQRLVGEVSSLLCVSHKETLMAYVYTNADELHACREAMFALWAMLLRHLEAADLRFSARTDVYQLVRQLIRRDELAGTLHDSSDGGSGRTSIEHLLRWRELGHRTLAWVLKTVSDPPVGGDGPPLRDFCAEVMAIWYFRLPFFAQALLDALQSEDVLQASVPEFRGIAFTLDCTPEPAMLAARGFEALPPLDWSGLELRAVSATARGSGGASGGFGGASNDSIHGSSPRGVFSCGSAGSLSQIAAAEAAASQLQEAIAHPGWRLRMRKRGHLFCRVFIEWMRVVCGCLEASTPPHFFAWPQLAGFKTMLTCTLLEMKLNTPSQYAEPLVELTNQLLHCTHLHSVLIKIVFLQCSVHDLRTVSTTLNLMNSWLTSLLQRMLNDTKHMAEAAPVSQPLLRSTFDFGFFFTGVGLLLDSEHAQVLLKALEFLYRHFDLLPEAQADKLRGMILRQCYWRLLLHWSPTVRNFFLHLLVFRLEKPCGWSLPRLTVMLSGANGWGTAAALNPTMMQQFDERLVQLQRLVVKHEADVAGHCRPREPFGSESEIPELSHAYAAPALATYQHLQQARRELDAALAAWEAEGHLKSEEPPQLPTLHWDTSVLDTEEDRVIWVRESELGKGVRAASFS